MDCTGVAEQTRQTVLPTFVGDQQSAGFIEREPDRTAMDDVLGHADGLAATEGNETTL